MLSKLKKMLVVIPCMILGLFLFSNVKVSAADAALTGINNSIVIGEQNKENTYYFTNGKVWEFKAEYDAIKNWDTYLKYRVVRPDGKATDWSKAIYYVDTGGIFTINDYTSLNYDKTEDVSTRNSIAPLSTYYVDIQYYGRLIISWNQNKDETVKIVVCSEKPDLTISKNGENYTVNSSLLDGTNGKGIVTEISYFFSTTPVTLNTSVEFDNARVANSTGGVASFTPSNAVGVEIEGVSSDYKYLYVMSKSGNKYYTIQSYDIENNAANPDEVGSGVADTNPGIVDGIGDLKFGELFLLILVVVLIVGCALVIAQKIVDYKKRLY